MAIVRVPDVFSYRDYREYLGDIYTYRKHSEYGFSYRAFSKRAGLAAPNYLKLVTEGQRNLTAKMAQRFADALSLSGECADYFCDLVAFNQAEGAPERERCYLCLRRYKRYRKAFQLDAAHAAYHGEWYIPAIRELVACEGFNEDAKWIGRQLRPPISTRQVSQALSILAQLGLISRNQQGKWGHDEPLLATGEHQPLHHHLGSFHRMMLQKAAEAIELVPRDEREIGALTLALNQEQIARFKKRLYQLREELFQESLSPQPGPNQVVQINFQMFPLTQISDESDNT